MSEPDDRGPFEQLGHERMVREWLGRALRLTLEPYIRAAIDEGLERHATMPLPISADYDVIAERAARRFVEALSPRVTEPW